MLQPAGRADTRRHTAARTPLTGNRFEKSASAEAQRCEMPFPPPMVVQKLRNMANKQQLRCELRKRAALHNP